MISILLVDDHSGFRGALARILSLHDDLVVSGQAGDGHEAVAAAAAIRPDVVMMDLGLPGLDGIAATRAILSSQPCPRVVVLTSSVSAKARREAAAAGACRLLDKGCPHERIVQTVREVAGAAC